MFSAAVAPHKVTTDHNLIRKWAEERQGAPATVKSTGDAAHPGILRIDFPGYSGEGKLEHISWEDFFKKFDEAGLAFLYQDKLKDGETSRFFKFGLGGCHGSSPSMSAIPFLICRRKEEKWAGKLPAVLLRDLPECPYCAYADRTSGHTRMDA